MPKKNVVNDLTQSSRGSSGLSCVDMSGQKIKALGYC